MNVQDFIPRIEAAGFTLETDGADIVVRPFSRLTDSQRQFIKIHKPELLAILAGKAGDPDLTPVRAWLDAIGETGEARDEVLNLCRTNPEALAYYLRRAAESTPEPTPATDEDRATLTRLAELVQSGNRLEFENNRLARVVRLADIEAEQGDQHQGTAEPVHGHHQGDAGRVVCGDCGHFRRDRIGDGSGIGRCAVLTDPPGGLLWPKMDRRCSRFEAITTTEAAP
jgi:hypothetical protein